MWRWARAFARRFSASLAYASAMARCCSGVAADWTASAVSPGGNDWAVVKPGASSAITAHAVTIPPVILMIRSSLWWLGIPCAEVVLADWWHRCPAARGVAMVMAIFLRVRIRIAGPQ